ncbi:glycosyltransferase family 4 protein [Chitinispirillales bacterium ANBcel5]|uniref:glycosyltransferase family 4 protein n=1 Tax=Cellulosispirillum alkaliphilum TaxID=3039283 RepID=UPI002A555285|nr:glycosyltransferase family 4 protein [Chitinispirillales bacterium ANBcel5]
MTERLAETETHIHIIPFNRLRLKSFGIIKFFVGYMPAFIKFFLFLKSKDIKLVHFSDLIDAPFYPCAYLSGARCMSHVRVAAGKGLPKLLFRFWTRTFCSKVIFISHFLKNFYAINGKFSEVIYNPGPDLSIFNPSVKSNEYSFLLKEERVPVVMTASFRIEKGHYNFIDIAHKVQQTVPGKAFFIIIGGKVEGHENYYNDVMTSIVNKGLQNSFLITGNLSHLQIAKILKLAGVFLMVPDWQEGLGGAHLEAMALKTPVVCYDSGGLAECFTDSVSGFLVPKHANTTAAQKVAYLIANKKMREKMGNHAYDELKSRFSHQKYISSIENCYCSLLEVSM